MSCPYLIEVTVAFCGASPFKKPIPVNRLSPGSPCSDGPYAACPIYRERLANEARVATEFEEELLQRGGAT